MWPRFAILTAFLAIGFSSQSTASVPETLDSPAAALDSVASLEPESPQITVQLERDSTIAVARVEPSSMGYVRAIHNDGTEEYLPYHEIRWIRDAEGRDRTSHVLDRGKSIGNAPVSIRYRPQRGARTLRGRPLPFKSSFPVIQVGVLARLDRDRQHSTEHPTTLAIDLGAVKNVSKRWGAGASLFYAGDEHSSRYGVKVRFRRWLGSAIALDAAPGVLFAEEEGRSPAHALPGFVGELGLSLGDWISVTGQVEATNTEERYYTYSPYPYNFEAGVNWRSNTEVSWYLGAKLGGEAAMGTFIAAFLLGAILVHGGSAVY